jgi:ribonuclease HII
LRTHGICVVHRRSFAPVRELMREPEKSEQSNY